MIKAINSVREVHFMQYISHKMRLWGKKSFFSSKALCNIKILQLLSTHKLQMRTNDF